MYLLGPALYKIGGMGILFISQCCVTSEELPTEATVATPLVVGKVNLSYV